MAIVYAEMDELENFQELLEATSAPLESVSISQEDLIHNTIYRMNDALVKAQENEKIMENHYYDAQKKLDEAEARTMEYNRHLEEGQEAMTTPEYYFERLDECSVELQYSVTYRKSIENTISDFEAYCVLYRNSQTQIMQDYFSLLKKSRNFFERYIGILIQAKKAIFSNNGQESDSSGDNNYNITLEPLDENDIHNIMVATGWSKETIVKKCSKNGALYRYHTINEKYENQLHTSGIIYIRSNFEIGGVLFEGVFPKFNAVLDISLSQSLWKASYSTQFSFCNQQLQQEIQKNPVLANNFSSVQLKQIAASRTPSGYTWNHLPQPGQMQLVRKKEHNVSAGGAPHTGGAALWC